MLSKQTIELAIDLMKLYKTVFFESVTVKGMGYEKSPYWQNIDTAISELEAELKRIDEEPK